MKKIIGLLIVTSILLSFITPVFAQDGATRIYVYNRYDTAYEVADTLKGVLGVEKFDTVIIASGTNFADALAGSYLAAKKSAPILMACNDRRVNDVTLNYIYANVNHGGTVYILGGYSALPLSLDGSLANYNVVRLAGNNRYETNLEILKEAGITNEPLLVATGKGFADSLSASATGLPILLVDKLVSEHQKEFLQSLTLDNVYIIGGTSAVSNEVESEMYKLVDQPVRLAGKNRYETSVLVANTFFDSPSEAVFAYGRNFPDGLSGGALAYQLGAPLLLIENSSAKTIGKYTSDKQISSGYVLGGPKLVSDNSLFNESTSDDKEDEDHADKNVSVTEATKPDEDRELLPSYTVSEVPKDLCGDAGKAFATIGEARAWAKAQIKDENSPWYGYKGATYIQITRKGYPQRDSDPWVVYMSK